jgi:class 3 adenylate cyclase
MPSDAGFIYRIKVIQAGKEQLREYNQNDVVVGRPKDGQVPDLDLYPDLNVSRRHCKFSFDGAAYWVEDIGSTGGTRLNDAEIKGHGRQQIPQGSTVELGDTTLMLELGVEVEGGAPAPSPAAAPAAKPAAAKPAARPFAAPAAPSGGVVLRAPAPPSGGFAPDAAGAHAAPAPAKASPLAQSPAGGGPSSLVPVAPSFTSLSPSAKPASAMPPGLKLPAAPAPEPEPDDAADMEIAAAMDVGSSIFTISEQSNAEMMKRLTPIMGMATEFDAEARIDTIHHRIIEHALNAIPSAKRGAFLTRNKDTEQLLLSAYIADGEPAVSETLARRAMKEKKGFIWTRGGFSGDVMASIANLSIQSGMYVPVMWQTRSLGVICVDNPSSDNAFTEDDLRMLVAISNYAAMVTANRLLVDEMRFNAKLLDRLLMNFSPRIRAKLLEKAHAGKLRPGGEKSEVTVLFSDMRGFTSMSANMDAADVVDLVNDYLPVLSAPIFKNDGTIDKFLGDAILAIFGSPDPDPNQFEKAVRAGLEMQEAVRELNERRKKRGDAIVEVGIGVHCGSVLHGFIGAQERLEFTVIGDAVNRCNRFCNGARGGEVLISAEVYQRVFRVVQVEKTAITTKHEGDLPAYRIKGMK